MVSDMTTIFNKPVNITRDEARKKLSMMVRGQSVDIGGVVVDFDEYGHFLFPYRENCKFCTGPSLNKALDKLFN